MTIIVPPSGETNGSYSSPDRVDRRAEIGNGQRPCASTRARQMSVLPRPPARPDPK